MQPLPIYQTEKPYNINVPTDGIPNGSQTNEVSGAYHNIPIHSLRDSQHGFDLDREGFRVATVDKTILDSATYDDYRDESVVARRVGPAMEQFLKATLKAETVITFAFRVRALGPT